MQNVINEFEFAPADMRLIKYESGTETPLAGAVFELFDENNAFVGRYVTDANGEILADNLDSTKQYYFVEVKPPYGYEKVGAGTTPLLKPGSGDTVVYNSRAAAGLSINKTIGDTDVSGVPYTPTQAELEFPFEFTVTLGTDRAVEYDYEICDAGGNRIASYVYEAEGFGKINVSGIGKIKSGEKLYLRHGETVKISPLPSLLHYSVTEKCYVTNNYDRDATARDEFGCEDNHIHDTVIGTTSGWVTAGDNTVGNVAPGGSLVTYVNRRIPAEYKITMSSLVLVDRILAHPDDIDPGKGFQVTVRVGADPDQQYYYDIVHTKDVGAVLPGYDLSYDYYNRNDPGLPPPITPEEGAAAVRALLALPYSYAAPKLPLHKPSDYERWAQTNGALPPLQMSPGNTIVTELHHGSALIIYGIPVGTHYTAEQVDYRDIDGYILAETIKTEGDILPDLEVLPDTETPDPRLLRVRADFYNYFVLPVTRKLTIHKRWDNTGNPGTPPSETEIDLIDINTGMVYDSRVRITSVEEWEKTVTVPKYDPITGKPIDYGLAEHLPPNYVISGMEETEDGFAITNTYAPATVKPSVRKVIKGGTPTTGEAFTFLLESETPSAPMPPPGGERVTMKGGGINFFGSIKYEAEGTYRYRITEQKGSAEGYTYDDTVYRVEVVVTKNSAGELTAAAAYTLDGNPVSTPLVFTNHYAGSGSLEVSKQAVGVGADPEKQFRFTVEIEGKAPEVIWLKSGEKHKIDNLPIGTKYTVTEADYTADGYVTTPEKGYTGVITAEGAKAQFVNTNSTPRPTANLTVTKRVQGDGADKSKRFSFTVTIGGFKYLITLADGERYTFTNIPVGTAYMVEEANTHGYSTTSTNSTGTIPTSGVTAVFTNNRGDVSPDDKGKLTVTKTVTGKFMDTTKRFHFTVKIGDKEHTFSLRHGESKTFDNIPAGTSYTVTEDSYSSMGYVTTGTGAAGTIVKGGQTAKFTNEYISDTPPKPEDDAIQISGHKTWVHGANPEGSRPQSITVYAMNGTAIAAEKTVTAGDGWAYAFNLPRRDEQGSDITYSINEGAVPGYSKSVSGCDITNTYTPGGGDDGPDTGDTVSMLPWFLLLIAGTIGLRTAIFYKSKRRSGQ